MSKQKRYLNYGLLVLAIVILLGAVYKLKIKLHDDTTKNTASENLPCSVIGEDSILTQASRAFLVSSNLNTQPNEKSEELHNLEKQIVTQKDFNRDANCLHIMTMIAIQNGNSSAGQQYLQDLKSLYSQQEVTYILDQNANFLSIAQMDEALKNIESQYSEVIENNPFAKEDRSNERQ